MSFREDRLKERVAEVRPGLQKAREVAELAESEHREMTDAEQKIYDEGVAKARSVADAMKQHRHDQEVFAVAKDLSDNVIGGLSHDDSSSSGAPSKSRRLSFKGMGTKVTTQMLGVDGKGSGTLWRRRVGLTVKEYPMATLTYFTCKLHYMSVVRHEFDDTDADPEVKGINAGVTITAFIQQPPPKGDDVNPDEIQAGTLAPDIAMVVLVPVDCRLDNGILMLRADPDLDVDSFNSFAGFPATGPGRPEPDER